MLMVKFHETFQSRYAEWCMASGMTLFGALMIGNEKAFSQPFYAVLRQVFVNANALGWIVFLIGMARMIVLFINGAWRRTPLFRLIGCLMGMLLAAFLMVSTMALDWITPTVSFWAMMFFLEATSLRFATGDNIVANRATVGTVDARGG